MTLHPYVAIDMPGASNEVVHREFEFLRHDMNIWSNCRKREFSKMADYMLQQNDNWTETKRFLQLLTMLLVFSTGLVVLVSTKS